MGDMVAATVTNCASMISGRPVLISDSLRHEFDSLSQLEFMLSLEESLSIDLPDEILQGRTFLDVARAISAYMSTLGIPPEG